MTELARSPYEKVLPAGEFAKLALDDGTEDFGRTVIRPAPVRKRDFWRVLLGRYQPKFVISRGLTVKGTGKIMKDVWCEGLRQKLERPSPLLNLLRKGS